MVRQERNLGTRILLGKAWGGAVGRVKESETSEVQEAGQMEARGANVSLEIWLWCLWPSLLTPHFL